MPQAAQGKVENFNFRVEPELKAAFVAAAAADDRPAGQLLRDFMRRCVAVRARAEFAAEAKRQSRLIAADTAAEAEIIDWIGKVSDRSGWV